MNSKVLTLKNKYIRKNNLKTSCALKTKVISFASGKGGVGKSCVVVNIAAALGELGQRVLILDADLSLANIDILLGIKAEATIEDVLNERATLEDVIVEGPQGICIIPAASGVTKMLTLTDRDHSAIAGHIENCSLNFDYLLVDSAAGIGKSVTYFCGASHQIVCIVNSDPTSLADAYALLKVLTNERGERSYKILVNGVSSKEEGEIVFKRLYQTAQAHLNIELELLGIVPYDPTVRDSVKERSIALLKYPSSKASIAFKGIADYLHLNRWDIKVSGGAQFFFQQLLEAEVS